MGIKDKPHPCPECPRSFPTPGDLRHHMKIHSSPSSSPFTFPGNHNQPSSAPSSPSPPSPTSSTDLTAQRGPSPTCLRPSQRKNLLRSSKKIDLILLFSEDLLLFDK